jgi:hypothetical protein
MSDLSACYFCGAALDEPLGEYPVLPQRLQPAADQQRTVVLCQGCRRKLGTVVDSVLDAVEDAPEGTAGDESAADAAGTAFTFDDGEDESGEQAAAPDGRRQEPGLGTDQAASDSDEESEPAGPEATSHGDRDQPSSSAGSSTDAGGEDHEPEAAGGGSATEPSDAGDDGAEDPDDAATGEEEDADPSLTALEYTKVMRLLENRELPVDREEIRVVATNAYQIRPAEFDTIVDAAIERGMIVEEDGQFVATE